MFSQKFRNISIINLFCCTLFTLIQLFVLGSSMNAKLNRQHLGIEKQFLNGLNQLIKSNVGYNATLLWNYRKGCFRVSNIVMKNLSNSMFEIVIKVSKIDSSKMVMSEYYCQHIKTTSPESSISQNNTADNNNNNTILVYKNESETSILKISQTVALVVCGLLLGVFFFIAGYLRIKNWIKRSNSLFKISSIKGCLTTEETTEQKWKSPDSLDLSTDSNIANYLQMQSMVDKNISQFMAKQSVFACRQDTEVGMVGADAANDGLPTALQSDMSNSAVANKKVTGRSKKAGLKRLNSTVSQRRQSLTNEIDSVMNKHFSMIGVSRKQQQQILLQQQQQQQQLATGSNMSMQMNLTNNGIGANGFTTQSSSQAQLMSTKFPNITTGPLLRRSATSHHYNYYPPRNNNNNLPLTPNYIRSNDKIYTLENITEALASSKNSLQYHPLSKFYHFPGRRATTIGSRSGNNKQQQRVTLLAAHQPGNVSPSRSNQGDVNCIPNDRKPDSAESGISNFNMCSSAGTMFTATTNTISTGDIANTLYISNTLSDKNSRKYFSDIKDTTSQTESKRPVLRKQTTLDESIILHHYPPTLFSSGFGSTNSASVNLKVPHSSQTKSSTNKFQAPFSVRNYSPQSCTFNINDDKDDLSRPDNEDDNNINNNNNNGDIFSSHTSSLDKASSFWSSVDAQDVLEKQ